MENQPATTSNTSTTTPSSTSTASNAASTQNPPVMHSFTETKTTAANPMKAIIIFLVVALFGVGTGYGLSFLNSSNSAVKKALPLPAVSSVEKGKTYGTGDEKTFKDTAEGKVEEGGIKGEGQFHLVRPGGESQNVYMTSSTVDLSQFVGKTVKVWGATQTAQHAGWLMDVGKVQVLE